MGKENHKLFNLKTVIIADFGFSKHIFDAIQKKINIFNSSSSSGLKGTIAYMSPGIFKNTVFIYAYSLIVYDIITNTDSFANLN